MKWRNSTKAKVAKSNSKKKKIENLKTLCLLKKLNSQLSPLTRKLIGPNDIIGKVYQIDKAEINPSYTKPFTK